MALTLKKVLISDSVAEKCVQILQENGIEVVKNTKLTKEELIAEIPKYDGLIVRSATKVTADVIAAADNLKIIGRAGTGVDNIDCNAATKKGIIVMNTPGGNTLSAAELTCTLILATSRHISRGTSSLQAGRWDRSKLMGNEVYGKTLAIVGLGRIGKEVGTRMQSFGMTTIGYDPIIPASEAAEWNCEWMELEKLWPLADYITVHTPLIPQTRDLINDEVFGKCKKGVRIINCARGGIVSEEGLLRALESGACGGAGLDVFIEEPPKESSVALINHPLVTSTPHLGASTKEAQARVAEEIAQQFVDLVEGKSLFGAINAHAMTNALSADTKPWVELGKALGKVASIVAGPVTKDTQIQVDTQGCGMKNASSYLSAAALVGLLSQGNNGLNLVSAPAMAKEQGIKVGTSHSADGCRQVTLTVKQGSGESVSLSGLVAGDMMLLTAINGTQLSQGATLQGNLLLYAGDGNVLGAVVAALAKEGATIKSYASTAAWNVMQVTSSIAKLDTVLEHVKSAHQVAV